MRNEFRIQRDAVTRYSDPNHPRIAIVDGITDTSANPQSLSFLSSPQAQSI